MAEPEAHSPEPSHKQALGTGLVYDDRLTSHYCAWNQAYTERPERIETCYSRIQQLGLPDRCQHIPVRPAKDEEALLCHSRAHLDMLEETKLMDTQELSKLSQSYDFVYFHNNVEENARLALGGAIDLVEKVVTGQLQNGMAVTRPPGHHAMKEEFNGYCYLNNVAVAASVALEKHGLKRVLIVDWDVHHGQGTQFHFYDDPRVLFFSIHRYEHGLEWPHLRESDYDYIGEGKGAGYNFNVPLNETGCDNSDYLSIFFNVLLPVAYEYQPQLVLISAGFDAAIGCPEGEMCLSPACFAHFINLLRPLAGGKIALILEGGYCLKTLAEGAALSLRALLGDPTPNIPSTQPARNSVVESVLNVVKVHRALHPSLAYQDTLTEEEEENGLPGMSLRTQHKRPDQYPLVQECCSPVSDMELAMLDRHITQLEENTVLTVPEHRVGLLLYCIGDEMPNGKSDRMFKKLRERGLLSRCHLLQERSNSKDLDIQFQLPLVLAAMTEEKVQSCVMIPQTLILSLLEGQNSLPVVEAGQESSVLVMSVGCGSDGDSGVSGKGRPQFVSVPTSRNQMGDGDLMAVCQQILLPIAYEFGPDLVIVCLNMPSTEGEGGPSAACVAHIVALMQGLARGHMLLFAKSGTKDDLDVVSECSSVMLGDPCKILDPCIPQP
ncbi:hypothetical protein BaRGS_00032718, partial [Batillaria attramentaria]